VTDASQCFLQALAGAQAIEDGVETLRRNLGRAFAGLRDLDRWLAEVGMPTTQPELLRGDGTDLNGCLGLARDVTGRLRRACAIGVALTGPVGRA
jgi:hypothetical protein